MIKLAFLDVGETLIHDGRPYPGVIDALGALSRFETTDGGALFLGAVSDYYLPEPPPTEAKVAALEERYRNEVLMPAGLEAFFEPFASRVTLSSRAGVYKPDRRIFELAVERSGTGAALGECLFVTENSAHLEKCREYGITPVRFGPGPGPSFEDWADAPAVIAEVVAPGHPGNRAAAVGPVLAVRHGLTGFVPFGKGDRSVRGQANRLVQLKDPRLGPLDGVQVELPAEVSVELGTDGRVADVTASPPDPEEVADAVNYVCGLVKGHKVAIPGQRAPAFGTTHTVEQDEAGQMRLVRRGYSAV
jgi:hypothetical protein